MIDFHVFVFIIVIVIVIIMIIIIIVITFLGGVQTITCSSILCVVFWALSVRVRRTGYYACCLLPFAFCGYSFSYPFSRLHMVGVVL